MKKTTKQFLVLLIFLLFLQLPTLVYVLKSYAKLRAEKSVISGISATDALSQSEKADEISLSKDNNESAARPPEVLRLTHPTVVLPMPPLRHPRERGPVPLRRERLPRIIPLTDTGQAADYHHHWLRRNHLSRPTRGRCRMINMLQKPATLRKVCRQRCGLLSRLILLLRRQIERHSPTPPVNRVPHPPHFLLRPQSNAPSRLCRINIQPKLLLQVCFSPQPSRPQRRILRPRTTGRNPGHKTCPPPKTGHRPWRRPQIPPVIGSTPHLRSRSRRYPC